MRGPVVLGMTLFAFLVVVVSCTTSYPLCYRGEYRGCACANGATGYQQCDVNENAFEACLCDGRTPGLDGGRDAAVDAAADAPGPEAGAGAYMTSCGPGDTCATDGDFCFMFGNKGKVCTRRCTQVAECPPPSKGCSANQGLCSAP